MGRLWSHRWLVATALTLTLVCSVASAYHIALFPPKISPRDLSTATANIELAIDAKRSALPDLGQNLRPLTSRIPGFEDLMGSNEFRSAIARRAAIPPASLIVRSVNPESIPRNLREAGPDERGVQVLEESRRHMVTITAAPQSTVMHVTARAESVEDATGLAAATAAAFNWFMSRHQLDGARGAVKARVLGEPVLSAASSFPNPLLAFGTGLVVFSLLCVIISVGGRARAGRCPPLEQLGTAAAQRKKHAATAVWSLGDSAAPREAYLSRNDLVTKPPTD